MAIPITKERQYLREKSVDNLLKLMQDVRLQFKRAHKELNRRDKWKKSSSFRYIIAIFKITKKKGKHDFQRETKTCLSELKSNTF